MKKHCVKFCTPKHRKAKGTSYEKKMMKRVFGRRAPKGVF